MSSVTTFLSVMNASKLREQNHRKHPAWQPDDEILQLCERYENIITELELRIEDLEREVF